MPIEAFKGTIERADSRCEIAGQPSLDDQARRGRKGVGDFERVLGRDVD